MVHQTFTLKNGLRVIFIDTKAFPTVTTLLLIGAGSRYENEKNNGISHFLEHMFFKGSKKYPTPEIVSTTIEGLGGAWNAFTSKNYTGYYIKAATSHFEKMIDILSDILLNPKFEEKEIIKEKGVVTEEINMYEDQPQMKVGELFENLIYKGNSLGMDVIGTKHTVAGYTRNTVVDYMRQLYRPNNAVLIIAGGLEIRDSASQFLSHESLTLNLSKSSQGPLGSEKIAIASSQLNYYLNIIKEKFNGWERGEFSDFIKVKESQKEPQKLIYNKKTEQAHFCLGFRAFGIKDERKYILSVLSMILGGGASSRLFVEVREKRGLCYYIHTGRELYQDVGYIVTQAGVTKEEGKVKEAVNAVINEYEKIKKGVTKEEMIKAKEMIKGRMLLSLEDSFNVANYFGMKKLIEDKTETPEELIVKIEKVTSEQVVKLAKELFTKEKMNFSIIGPLQQNFLQF